MKSLIIMNSQPNFLYLIPLLFACTQTHINEVLDTDARSQLCAVLDRHLDEGKRIIAWIHGHTHKSDFYEWRCPRPYRNVDIPVFNVGSPFYTKEENADSVHFSLFRLGNETLEALDVSAQLDEDGDIVFQMPGVSTENDRDDFNPDDLYGGWVVVLERHLRRPN